MADQLITKRTPCCGSALSVVTDQGDCRSCGAYVSGLDSRLRAEFAAQARRVTASTRAFAEAERAARLTSDVAIDELTQYRRHLEVSRMPPPPPCPEWCVRHPDHEGPCSPSRYKPSPFIRDTESRMHPTPPARPLTNTEQERAAITELCKAFDHITEALALLPGTSSHLGRTIQLRDHLRDIVRFASAGRIDL